jgi:hypothetical protein
MPRRPAPLLVPLALVVGWLGAGAPARAQQAHEEQKETTETEDAESAEQYQLRAELGPELDTNAHRTEIVNVAGADNPPLVSSPLARAVLTASLSDVVGDGNQVAMSATFAAKIFEKAAARDEDVAIAETSLLWRAPLNPGTALAVAGAYYEAFQRDAAAPVYADDRRDFRSLTPTVRLLRAIGAHAELGVGAGYRAFVYKPDHSFDFQAPTANLELRWGRETEDGGADWEAAFRAFYERRAFAGAPYVEPACQVAPPCPPVSGTGARLDHFVTGALDVTRTGRVLLGAGYALQLNRSNSYGETVTRHFGTIRFAAALPLDLYLALRAEILFAYYADQVFVAPTLTAARPYASIEDENRNNLRVDLSRNLTERLQLIARYTFYSNELGDKGTYRRQTALLTLAFTIEK